MKFPFCSCFKTEDFKATLSLRTLVDSPDRGCWVPNISYLKKEKEKKSDLRGQWWNLTSVQ